MKQIVLGIVLFILIVVSVFVSIAMSSSKINKVESKIYDNFGEYASNGEVLEMLSKCKTYEVNRPLDEFTSSFGDYEVGSSTTCNDVCMNFNAVCTQTFMIGEVDAESSITIIEECGTSFEDLKNRLPTASVYPNCVCCTA